MRTLASFAMGSRARATLVASAALVTSLFAWLGAAIVGLVYLCQGQEEGAKVLFWALLPAIILLVLGDPNPIATLLGVVICAVVLRKTLSWSLTLFVATVVAAVFGTLLHFFGQAHIDSFLVNLREVLAETPAPSGAANKDLKNSPLALMPSVPQLIALFALGNALTVMLCAVLARWWQSCLYNPGAFGAEFRRFRLPPMMVIVLTLSALALTALDNNAAESKDAFGMWALLCFMPMLIAGFGLVHGLVAKWEYGKEQGSGKPILVVFYMLWFLLTPLKQLLLLLVIVDSWLNFRERIKLS